MAEGKEMSIDELIQLQLFKKMTEKKRPYGIIILAVVGLVLLYLLVPDVQNGINQFLGGMGLVKTMTVVASMQRNNIDYANTQACLTPDPCPTPMKTSGYECSVDYKFEVAVETPSTRYNLPIREFSASVPGGWLLGCSAPDTTVGANFATWTVVNPEKGFNTFDIKLFKKSVLLGFELKDAYKITKEVA